MRTIAIINQKGGCGKTTCSINLAAVLAARGHKTLLVDIDPQAHCALGLAVPEAQIEKSTTDLLRHGLDGSIALADIVWQVARNLDLAPSTMALAGIEQELANVPDKDRRLVQVLSTVADRYEYCIIDCPPSIGLLTFNALRAADEVIIPVETGYFAMQGSFKQKATIEMLARRAGHAVRFTVLATMYDVRTKLAREILAELRKHFGEYLLPIVVHFNSKLKEAASFGQPIVEYDPASRGMQDFEALATWLSEHPPANIAMPTEIAAHSISDAFNQQFGTGSIAPGYMPAGSAIARTTASPLAPGQYTAPTDAPRQGGHANGSGQHNGADNGNGTSPGSSPATVPGHAPATRATNPAMSRAAELVERARVLSARTAALAARLGGDKSHTDDGRPITTPRPPVRIEPAAPAQAPEKPHPHLAAKLARMHGVRTTSQGTLFVQPYTDAQQIAVAGDFNNWSPTATPLKRNEELNVFQACVEIPPGRYRYRLVVDGHWVNDPYNSYVEANPFGELNSILEINAEPLAPSATEQPYNRKPTSASADN